MVESLSYNHIPMFSWNMNESLNNPRKTTTEKKYGGLSFFVTGIKTRKTKKGEEKRSKEGYFMLVEGFLL